MFNYKISIGSNTFFTLRSRFSTRTEGFIISFRFSSSNFTLLGGAGFEIVGGGLFTGSFDPDGGVPVRLKDPEVCGGCGGGTTLLADELSPRDGGTGNFAGGAGGNLDSDGGGGGGRGVIVSIESLIAGGGGKLFTSTSTATGAGNEYNFRSSSFKSGGSSMFRVRCLSIFKNSKGSSGSMDSNIHDVVHNFSKFSGLLSA